MEVIGLGFTRSGTVAQEVFETCMCQKVPFSLAEGNYKTTECVDIIQMPCQAYIVPWMNKLNMLWRRYFEWLILGSWWGSEQRNNWVICVWKSLSVILNSSDWSQSRKKMMLIVQQNHTCIQCYIRRDVYPAVPEQRFSPILWFDTNTWE